MEKGLEVVVGTYPSEPNPALKTDSKSSSYDCRALAYFADQLSLLLETVPEKEQPKTLLM